MYPEWVLQNTWKQLLESANLRKNGAKGQLLHNTIQNFVWDEACRKCIYHYHANYP